MGIHTLNLKKTPKKIIDFIIGNENDFSFEHRFFNSILFAVIIVSCYKGVITSILNLNIWLIILSFITTIVFFIFYWLTRFKSILIISRWYTLSSLFVILGFAWFPNAGSNGPIIFIFFAFFLYILLILNGFTKRIFVFLLLTEITLLFGLEYFLPDLVIHYNSEIQRIIDLYSALIIYFTIAALIIIYARRNFIRQKEKAEKSDLLKSAFLANMSHEIRTPMNSIIGFSQLLKRSNISDEKKDKYLKIINDNGNYLLRIISDIIDVSKVECGQIQIIRKETDIKKIFENLFFIFRKLLDDNSKHNIDLSYNLPFDKISFKIDGTRLEQILTNLLFNAIKFTHKGKINYGCTIHKEELIFHVTDTGIGILNKDIDLIFDRFRKADDENHDVLFRGTGIGLSLSKSLVEMMDGTIWVTSIFGEGSTFFFSLPALDLKTESINEKAPFKKKNVQNWKGKKMLLVEDEESNYYLIEELLFPTRIDIFLAKNGKEAIEMALNSSFDIVIMDMKLPEMNGYDATKIIKAKKPGLPVIAQTAYAMSGDKKQCLDCGCDDYIAKPVDGDLLIEKISRFINR